MAALAIEMAKQCQEDLICLQAQFEAIITCKINVMKRKQQHLEEQLEGYICSPPKKEGSKKDPQSFLSSQSARRRKLAVSEENQGVVKVDGGIRNEWDSHPLAGDSMNEESHLTSMKLAARDNFHVVAPTSLHPKVLTDESIQGDVIRKVKSAETTRKIHQDRLAEAFNISDSSSQVPQTIHKPVAKKLTPLKSAVGVPLASKSRAAQNQGNATPQGSAQSRIQTGDEQNELNFLDRPTHMQGLNADHDQRTFAQSETHSFFSQGDVPVSDLPSMPPIAWEAGVKHMVSRDSIPAYHGSDTSSETDADNVEALEKTRQVLEASLPTGQRHFSG